MKVYTNKIVMLFAVLFLTLSYSVSSQIIVKVRPATPVIRVRPLAPSPRHIWVDGEWASRGDSYVWSDGYWATPRPGMVWIGGNWRHRRGGWVWVPGHWRRRY